MLDKPAGWLTHPAGTDAPDVLAFATAELGAPAELAAVHRLDRETSGLVLASPDPALRAELGELFAAGTVQKEYQALVFGRCHEKGVVRRALSDGRRGRPLPAVTRYRLLEWLGPLSLVRARPEHGRKHQIRRHLQAIGHAIVGDERYPPPRFRRVPGFPGRLWLHASRLELPDGRSWEAPLPPELAAHLALLRTLPGG